MAQRGCTHRKSTEEHAVVTLLLTCLLTAGGSFVPPDDWKVEKIVVGGRQASSLLYTPPIICYQQGFLNVCPEPETGTRIYLTRTLNLGDVVQAPEGCTLEMRGKQE